MTQEHKTKVIAASATTLFFLAFIGLVWMHDSNQTLSSLLEKARLEAADLMDQKSKTDKKLNDTEVAYSALELKNQDYVNRLELTNSVLEKKENELKRIQWDKALSAKLQKEVAELKKLKSKMESDLADIRKELQHRENDRLALVQTIEGLREKNDELESGNAMLRAMVSDNFRVEATKGKSGKLTAVAKKTNKLTVGFDVPITETDGIKFRLKTPEGVVLGESSNELSYEVTGNNGELMASVDGNDESVFNKRVEMTYAPKEKLTKGVYKIEIYNGDNYIGSCQVRLR